MRDTTTKYDDGDGAYDDGCPACSPVKRKAWLLEHRARPVGPTPVEGSIILGRAE